VAVAPRLAAAENALFPLEWRAILSGMPFYVWLDEPERARFEQKLKTFVMTKDFVVDEDDPVVMDDRVRVTIAATACRLTMNIPGENYGRLDRIHVRRGKFERDGELRGGYAESSCVHLSWETLSHQVAAPRPHDNVGFHEFAHALDLADGTLDGRPPLLFAPSLYRPWARVLSRHLESLREAVTKRIPTVLGAYAATNEGELFAVATERFFEAPVQLRDAYPEVYDLLVAYFRQDPAARLRTP
jgi:Mlc titration factor MtfA (ptsG expression regulator)